MMPKWITKPEPIVFGGVCPLCKVSVHPTGPLTFDEFLRLLVEDTGHFGANIKTTRAAARIQRASEKSSPGTRFVLDDEEHILLLAVLNGPTGRTWIPSFMNTAELFVLAIEAATDE